MRPLQLQEPNRSGPPRGSALFVLAFRPLFLLAGLGGALLILLWSLAFYTGKLPQGYYGAVGWHSHEMLFGFAAAVICGFLLTAAGNWTGLVTVRGPALAGLAAVWMAGRLLALLPLADLGWLVALVDMSFLLLAAWFLARPIIRVGHYKSLMFVAIILLLAAGNALVHLQKLGLWDGLAQRASYATALLIALLIAIMGGRVIPYFTEKSLNVSVHRWNWNDLLGLGLLIALIVLELMGQTESLPGGLLALAAALSHGLRLAGWQACGIWRVPLLWVLHLGYAWLVLGLALWAWTGLGEGSRLLAVHALMVGGLGMVGLGMMSRVSLGHTGRPLELPGWIVPAFGLGALAALLRVLLPLVAPAAWYPALILGAGLAWTAAFALFLIRYLPILYRPRISNGPG